MALATQRVAEVKAAHGAAGNNGRKAEGTGAPAAMSANRRRAEEKLRQVGKQRAAVEETVERR